VPLPRFQFLRVSTRNTFIFEFSFYCMIRVA